MKSGLHMDEYSSGGSLPPGSPEAAAAIARVGRELCGAGWRPGTVIESTHGESKKDGNHRLTEDRVREIKRALRRDGKKLREVAVEFGTSIHTIKAISRGAAWTDVEIDDEVAA